LAATTLTDTGEENCGDPGLDYHALNAKLNLYAAYNFKYGRVSMYADNVFNSRRPIFVSTNDRHDSLYQRPRAIGVSTELRF